jgi:hypothetical protein
MKNLLVDTEYSRNTGLGNKLFPWALAKIFAHQNNLKMLRQSWVSIRGAAVTRGGIDYGKIFRKIYLMDNFCNGNSKNEVHRLFGFFKQRYLVGTLSQANDLETQVNGVIVFASKAEHNFLEMDGYQNFIKKQLLEVTKEKWKKIQFPNKFIGLNIRWGNDFASASDMASVHRKTDINWFINSMRNLRLRGIYLPALVITDGPPAIMENFIDIDNIIYISNESAIADLLLLMNATIILGSGSSSFSAWAAFLSQSPYFSSPETPFKKYKIPTPKKNIELINIIKGGEY